MSELNKTTKIILRNLAMSDQQNGAAKGSESRTSALLCPFAVGDAVVATANIWDDGEDHHPPGWLAKKGERLIVRRVGSRYISVSHHNVTNSSFMVEQNEIRQA